MDSRDFEVIQTLSKESKVLLFFLVYSVEWALIGGPQNDDSTYCKEREKFLKSIETTFDEQTEMRDR